MSIKMKNRRRVLFCSVCDCFFVIYKKEKFFIRLYRVKKGNNGKRNIDIKQKYGKIKTKCSYVFGGVYEYKNAYFAWKDS